MCCDQKFKLSDWIYYRQRWTFILINKWIMILHKTRQSGRNKCVPTTCHKHKTWEVTADIDRRSQDSYTSLCNGVVSHGAPIGDIRVFADHTSGNKRKQNAFTIFARRFMCTYLYAQAVYAPDESRLLFWSREKPKYSQLESHAGIKMAQCLGSPVYICESFSRSIQMQKSLASKPRAPGKRVTLAKVAGEFCCVRLFLFCLKFIF